MKAFICLDDKNGVLFNKRRLSKDRILNEKVAEVIGSESLHISAYTQSLFPNAIVCDDFANVEGYAFIEDPAHLIADKIEMLYVFKWNRHYPSDKKFTMELDSFEKVGEEEFAGYSHEKITLEIYKKK